jgi:hypothetical protein
MVRQIGDCLEFVLGLWLPLPAATAFSRLVLIGSPQADAQATALLHTGGDHVIIRSTAASDSWHENAYGLFTAPV